ncbi:MAG: polyribonucleotide nucleotidyltransferase [Candidatus Omnitrophica bacterium CG11_big_fil_rev_8_21_14_0_20_42_13]|uniref:Polyribonucleotide nucleotidyltransferase n=1 Tax=Candidatus Ghiorseimicrobium undicola TaxID=1974746 RepID=A0A2H0LWV3_9BACT|nr:MAG: polyribonucleotide nucleotidyltransferase [Candidatus Omnitrophica bacterium CG11_big_fil_rev_8_21_14_0_20_42_13]
MHSDIVSVQTSFGRQNLFLETGKLAKQADGAVIVTYGGTVVLVTACVSKEAREGIDFLPLTVEYKEKTYAAGKIPGGFFKREGRPSESEILTCRLIDRPIRPLFPKGFVNEIQVMGLVLSSDGENDPDILAVIGASSALSISGIPFLGPIGAARVGLIDDNFIINPTYKELEKSELDLVVAGTKTGIIMLETQAKELSEEKIIEGIKFGHKHIQSIIALQEEFKKRLGRPQGEFSLKKIDTALVDEVKELSYNKLIEVCSIPDKEKREEEISLLSKSLVEKFAQEAPEVAVGDVKLALIESEKEQVRRFILKEGKRVDGRNYEDIRPISCEVGVLPRTHGSGLFTRGQTQGLAITTLGTASDEQMIESLEGETSKSFMLHYSFPPFSVGEVKPVRGPGRREIGHGALAEKALKFLMPSKDEFPYTVRVVSEILESNGSSSMATVCASALSLMDAGVPIRDIVAGIAMGLVTENDKYAILTDLNGLEDHFGDMDFKIAGTKAGISAVQLDLKIREISFEILEKSIMQAKKARFVILDKMKQAIDKPRENLSEFAPRIHVLQIDPEKRGELIGPGGKTIRKIIEETGVTIDIEDDGRVLVSSVDAQASERAIEKIKGITAVPEVGKIYSGVVKRIMNFGAFCEILPNKEGLVHVSELSDKFIKDPNEVVKVGDKIQVKVIKIDELGRVNLSKKQAEK